MVEFSPFDDISDFLDAEAPAAQDQAPQPETPQAAPAPSPAVEDEAPPEPEWPISPAPVEAEAEAESASEPPAAAASAASYGVPALVAAAALQPDPPVTASPGVVTPAGVGLWVGREVFGQRYRLERELGRGGMGVVWLAYDQRLNTHVALKFIPPELCHDPGAIDDLKREVLKTRMLSHENIVRIHDFEEGDGQCAISMEVIEGQSLTAIRTAKPGRVFETAELEPLIGQACAGLDYAHGRGIVHHDVKPANLLVDNGVVKICDFGLAGTMVENWTRPQRGGTSGTTPYMSPQHLFQGTRTPADDVYSLGATIYEALTGKPPFFRGSVEAQIEREIPAAMTDRRAELGNGGGPVPAAWEQVVARMLSKDPAQRPSLREVPHLLQKGFAEPAPEAMTHGLAAGGHAPPFHEEAPYLPPPMPPADLPGSPPMPARQETIIPLTPDPRHPSPPPVPPRKEAKPPKPPKPPKPVKPPRPRKPLAKRWWFALFGVALGSAGLWLWLLGPLTFGYVGLKHQFDIGRGQKIAVRYIPGGDFFMGTPTSEEGRQENEVLTKVNLTSHYWMGETEVTQDQWVAVMGSNPSRFNGGNLPVDSVSWQAARNYVDRLNQQSPLPKGWRWSLPSEAQWENACRVGKSLPYGGTAFLERQKGNFNSGSEDTVPAGTYEPNDYGLYDIHGNVWEWCDDWYLDQVPGGDDPVVTSATGRRLIRGGSGLGSETNCRCGNRQPVLADARRSSLGFRVAIVRSTQSQASQ